MTHFRSVHGSVSLAAKPAVAAMPGVLDAVAGTPRRPLTGVGVPDALIERLFKEFSQASQYRYGTGLGLYHAYELAKALGGTIWYAKNTPSDGAIFIVEVPFVPATTDESELHQVIVDLSLIHI